MESIFNALYYLFSGLYGSDLYNFLTGAETDGSNYFRILFLATLAFNLAVCAIYYYVPVVPIRLNTKGWWVLIGLVVAVISGICAYGYVDGMGDEMVYKDMVTGVTHALNVGNGDLVLFGISNAIISLFFFFVGSLLLKWGSANFSKVPF